MSRLGRLFCCLIPLLMTLGAAPCRAANTTTVQDIVYRADGTPAAGTLVISWPAFTAAGNVAVAAGSMSVDIGPQGAISIALVPNEGADPAGTYYKIVYKLSDGSTAEEYWTVPATGPTTIAAIRSKIVPASVATQVASRQYVDSAIAGLRTLPAKIVNADSYAGADWCAKVNAADAALGASPGQIWMTSAAGGTACSADVVINSGHTLRDAEGATYRLLAYQLKLDSKATLEGSGRVHTGSAGDATLFFYEGTASAIVPKNPASLSKGITLRNFGVADRGAWMGGTATAMAGVDLVNTAYCNVENVATYYFSKTGAAGFRRYTQGTVAGTYFCSFRRVYGLTNYDGMVWDADAAAQADPQAGYAPGRDVVIEPQMDNDSHVGYDLRVGGGGTHAFYFPKAEGFGASGIHMATGNNHVVGASIEDHHNAGQVALRLDGNGCGNYLSGLFWADPENDPATKIVDTNTCAGGVGNDTPGNTVETESGFGALKISGSYGLPKTANWHLWFGSDDDANRLGRMYVGDGSGTKRVEFATRSNSTDTPIGGIKDSTEFFLYRPTTYTDETHYEKGWLRWDGNIFALGTGTGGQGGSNRSLCLEPGGLQTLCSNSSAVFFNRDNLVDIGAAGYKPRTIYAGTSVDTPKLSGITDAAVVTNLNADKWQSKTATDFSASLDFGSIAGQSCAENTVSASGASSGNPVAPAWPSTLEAGLSGVMFASSGTVTIRLCNATASAIDPAPQTFGGRVIR